MNEVTIFGADYDGEISGKEYCERCGDEVVNFQCGCCPECDGSGWIPTTPLDGMEHYGYDSNGMKDCPLCCGLGY